MHEIVHALELKVMVLTHELCVVRRVCALCVLWVCATVPVDDVCRGGHAS